jgi:hypothetical protein
MVTRAAAAVNQALVLRNWLVAAHLVEFEQNGADRARYGARLLEMLAADLWARGIKGLNARVLERSRLLFLTYPLLGSAIPATLSPELEPALRRAPADACPSPLPVGEVLRFSWSHL